MQNTLHVMHTIVNISSSDWDWSIKSSLSACVLREHTMHYMSQPKQRNAYRVAPMSCISQITRDVITMLLHRLKSALVQTARLDPYRLQKDPVASRCLKFKDRVSLWYSRTSIASWEFLTYRRVSDGSAKSLRINGLALLTQSHRETCANFSQFAQAAAALFNLPANTRLRSAK